MSTIKRKKERAKFVCQSCGYESPRWLGRCPACESWNSFVEERQELEPAAWATRKERSYPQPLSEIEMESQSRIPTGSEEFDRVLGGGLVPGSLILLGGDPGIGKSTLLLQRLAEISQDNFPTLYVSGEESVTQTKMRAQRLGVNLSSLYVLAENDLHAIQEAINKLEPKVVIVDSIQTIYSPELGSAPGSISQVRECALTLMQVAKGKGIPVLLIGHVTKEGAIAGPRVLEHMVDALLYLEGDRQYQFRILRSVKNRFGSTNEIGVFEIREQGLVEVSNPSELFLSNRRGDISGSTVTCAIEGTRPLLVEIQALTTTASFGMPQRTAAGVDGKRLALLLAVLEKRAGLRLGSYDVFVKVAGGLRLDEPAVDLAIILAVASSFRNCPIDDQVVVVGEVGLGGEVRSISQIERRVNEAERLGFKSVYLPQENLKSISQNFQIEKVGVSSIQEVLQALL
ncbi:DNA repair protein RadA [bacterium]|nr:DNA repair protein RadA [bacterium]